MSVGQLVQPSHKSRPFGGYGTASKSKIKEHTARRNHLLNFSLSFCTTQRDCFTLSASNQICKPWLYVTSERERFLCHSFARPDCVIDIMKITTTSLIRSYDILHRCPLLLQLVPAFGIVAFAVWGLEPVLSHIQKLFQWKDSDWRKSKTHYVYTSYLQPVLLCAGVILICRALDPISLSTDASQAVKQRVLHFIRSLSTVSAFAFCISSLLKQMQKLNAEKMPSNDPRNMGFHFVGKAIYTAMWVAVVSLFMELLGFSTKKWLTAGGLGTVSLTLSGREIFTSFLSSLMIHATRPFVVNDWIQTKIEAYEVSGTVEHVDWWSPTIIRGEDQESVHIPNHKFTVNVVRNLSQKTHWRIKTHLAISHLDANKINNVVADMRKVLAKNTQIEQQRIHRRIFLEYIDTEKQAFMVYLFSSLRASFQCVHMGILTC